MLELNKIHQGDWINLLNQLDNENIDMCMTSPPYWGLRDYGIQGQLGLEPHPQEYINKLIDGFRILRNKLKKTGSFYLNLGDTYWGSGHGAGGDIENSKQIWTFTEKTKKNCANCKKEFMGWAFQSFCSSACSGVDNTPQIKKNAWLQSKQLMMMPSRIAIAMQEDGWILRNDIIWHKPNPMPSSVKDRLNTTYEHVFHFVRSRKYFYDLDIIREPHKENSKERVKYKTNPYGEQNTNSGARMTGNIKGGCNYIMIDLNPSGKNPGDFWDITTQPFREAHFATFPEKLCEKPIKASCPKEGIVLDIFSGAGTTSVVAKRLGRNFIGFELNPKYVEMSNKRLNDIERPLI